MEGFSDFFYQANDEVINMYLHTNKKIAEIAIMTGKSIGEIYRVLHNNNVQPNRTRNNYQNVIDFANSGMNTQQIAELTGYTPRNVRYIMAKKRRNDS